MPQPNSQRYQLTFLLIWIGVVGWGLFCMEKYAITPNKGAIAPTAYPLDVKFADETTDFSLMVFLHPHCACSGATLEELERITARVADHTTVRVIFWHPKSLPAHWHQTGLYARAQSDHGVSVIDDVGCQLTQRFGVKTSGQVLLYNKSGELLFSGGITPSRGHAGDTIGADTIISWIVTGSLPRADGPVTSPVFGCRLDDPQSATALSGNLR